MKTGSKLVLFALLILVNVVGIVTSARQEQRRVPAPLATESATPLPTETATEVASTATATSEFTATPSATATEIPGTPIAVNGGFELNGDSDDVPDNWQGKLLVNDKQICNKVNRPGKPDKIVAYAGNCAFQFKDGGGKLIQTSTTAYGDVNYVIWISAIQATKNLTAEYKIVVKLTYGDDTVNKFFLPINPGTYDYTWTAIDTSLTAPVTKTKLMIKGGAGTGRLWLDDVLLYTYLSE